MAASIFWYDLETTGVNPRRDRAVQVAGIRTDEDLNEVGLPLNIYCRLGDDILPHPRASLVTGIGPQQLQEQGLSEVEFINRLHAELIQPNTCTAGYNNLRFDDELTRFTLYRNFFDPYAREWQGGNSRWDLIDALRCAWALRPEGIQWPKNEQGQVSMRLELLTAANGIEHGQAHDALADVRATIAMARCLRAAQPQLYSYLYGLRSKHEVWKRLQLGQPVVHVSGRFSAHRHYFSIVLPLAQHPNNPNAVVVCDLLSDISPLLDLDAQALKEFLYTRIADLPAGQSPIPLKLIHVNKCPVVAPLSVLRTEDKQRLGVDDAVWQGRSEQLLAQQALLAQKLAAVYATEDYPQVADPEQQLYQGFLQRRDQGLCMRVRQAEPEQLAGQQWPFDDPRLPELLLRYRARNFPETLSAEEAEHWRLFCQQRLTEAASGAPLTLASYWAEWAELTVAEQQSELMQQWAAYVQQLQQRYELDG